MKYFFISLLVLSQLTASATTWYVTGKGDDANDGKSKATAFRNLQKAADLVEPGDEVLIGNGTYTSSDQSSASVLLNISRSGKPGAWITWKAITGEHPLIHPIGWTGILISGSYHILDGLTVIGNNDELVLVNAQEDAKKTEAGGGYNTNGIFINGRVKGPNEKPHHVIIRNCEVAKCPGGGITGIETDYVTIEDCKVHENAWYMRYAGSGITFLTNWAFDDAPGYHIIVQRNYVWDNKTMVAWEKIGKLSDGNGILMDVTNQESQGASNPNGDKILKPANAPAIVAEKPAEPAKPKRPEWKGRTLIANNVSAFNGGSGIHTFRTKHVDIINNTTYHNGQTVGYPELFSNASEDIVMLNNVMIPRPGGKVTSNNRNVNIRWDYNLYPTAQELKGEHDIIAEPGYIDAELNPLKGSFRLSKNSPGINSGTNELPQATDITGKKRPVGAGRDRGAFEQ